MLLLLVEVMKLRMMEGELLRRRGNCSRVVKLAMLNVRSRVGKDGGRICRCIYVVGLFSLLVDDDDDDSNVLTEQAIGRRWGYLEWMLTESQVSLCMAGGLDVASGITS